MFADERFKGQYYLNLTMLKPKKDNKSNIEESDKSLAILVNMLREKSEQEQIKNKKLQVIQEIESKKPNFNQVIRLNECKNIDIKNQKIIGEKFKKIDPNKEKKMNLKKKKNIESNQKKILFDNKPVINKQTQLISLPFQKLKGNSNLIIDKKRLLNHIKKKKNHREHQMIFTQRGTVKTLNLENQKKKKNSFKKSLSPNCVKISKLKKQNLKDKKQVKQIRKGCTTKKGDAKSKSRGKNQNILKLNHNILDIISKEKSIVKQKHTKTKRALSKRR